MKTLFKLFAASLLTVALSAPASAISVGSFDGSASWIFSINGGGLLPVLTDSQSTNDTDGLGNFTANSLGSFPAGPTNSGGEGLAENDGMLSESGIVTSTASATADYQVTNNFVSDIFTVQIDFSLFSEADLSLALDPGDTSLASSAADSTLEIFGTFQGGMDLDEIFQAAVLVDSNAGGTDSDELLNQILTFQLRPGDELFFRLSAFVDGEVQIDSPVAPVPLPAAFPLFAGGLGVLGLLGWRRKRLTAA